MVQDTAQISATGRRKTAVASVKIASGSGKITVNDRAFEQYFPTEQLRAEVIQPFAVVKATGKYDVTATISGGGLTGQAEALRHAIARALQKMSPELRPALKDKGLLTRDPRMKERKKYGQPGARKRFQFSKR
jgi:small subunit ribosomal protein S9